MHATCTHDNSLACRFSDRLRAGFHFFDIFLVVPPSQLFTLLPSTRAPHCPCRGGSSLSCALFKDPISWQSFSFSWRSPVDAHVGQRLLTLRRMDACAGPLPLSEVTSDAAASDARTVGCITLVAASASASEVSKSAGRRIATKLG